MIMKLKILYKKFRFFSSTQTKSLKLKNEFEEYYEPYIFGKYSDMVSKFYENLNNICQKNKYLDMIIGNMKKFNSKSVQKQVRY